MRTWLCLATAILLVVAGLAVPAAAETVGRLTQVEGRVDLLRAGKLPAVAAKLEDKVEAGDVIRTKSLSKAQITFIDNTVVTVSPESRIAIEEYMFDQSKGKRNAVLQLFQGMAMTVVSKIFKVDNPDFILKTQTAVMGVRGTEVGIRLGPNDSTFLNFQGLTRVASIFPEVSGDLFRKAAKVAFSFCQGYVDLRDMQGTTVPRGLPPTLPFTLTDMDRQLFMRQMAGNILSHRGGSGGAVSSTYHATSSASGGQTGGGCESGSGGGSGDSSSAITATGVNSFGFSTPVSVLNTGLYISPPVVPPTPAPTPPVHPPR